MEQPKKTWELPELLDLMVARKVLKVRMGGLEVELSPAAFQTADTTELAKQLEGSNMGPELKVPTLRELLMASTQLEEYDPEAEYRAAAAKDAHRVQISALGMKSRTIKAEEPVNGPA